MPAPILNLGIDIILFLQSLGEGFISIMKVFTFLGNEEFYLLIAPALYWCIDSALGLRVGLYLFISWSLNIGLKLAFHDPRPAWYDPRVHDYAHETSFGIPSGHAQNAVLVWGKLASVVSSRAAWIVAVLLMFAIGLSRIAIGTHFPSDVLAGWIVGALLLWLFPVVDRWVSKRLPEWRVNQQLSAALAVSVLIILSGLILRWGLSSWSLPESWVQNALATASGENPNPLAIKDFVTFAAVFLGFASGAIWTKAGGGMDAGGPLSQRLLRYGVGIAGMVAIWAGLDALFPDGESFLALGLRFLRYVLVGLWVSGLAPAIFLRLKLARRARAA